MANFDESYAGYNWETEGVYQIEKNDPVEGGPDGISNRQGRQLTRRTRDLHSRLVAVNNLIDTLTEIVNSKETPTGAQQKANAALAAAKAYIDALLPFDYIVDSDETLAGLNNNPDATSVLIKQGTWSTTGIMLHPNTKRIVGEPGSLIKLTTHDTKCFSYKDIPNSDVGYSIEGVSVLLCNGGAIGFAGMVNLINCKCEAPINPGSISSGFCGFTLCKNLRGCFVRLHEENCWGHAFLDCEYLQRCNVESEKVDDDTYGFSECKHLFQCHSDKPIGSSLGVFFCKAKEFRSSHYSPFYSQGGKNICANTLEGGWNEILTV